MWLATIMYNIIDPITNNNHTVHYNICCSKIFDNCLNFCLSNPENFTKLSEWILQYNTNLTDNQKKYIDDMRNGRTNGINIRFNNCDVQIDFCNIREV